MRLAPIRSATGLAVPFLMALVAGRAAGYGLEFTPRNDTVQHVAPDAVAEFHFTLTNTGTSSDVYEFGCRVVSSVQGWTAVYCARGVCVEPGVALYDTVPAGDNDTTPKVTVYTSSAEGEEVVSLSVRSMGDTTLAESVRTHTIVGSAIEESPAANAPQVWFQVVPEPVRRDRPVTLSFSTATPLGYRIDLFSAAGGWVGFVAGGTAHGGRQVINWHPWRLPARGVYLLRVTAGDESVVRKLVVE
jgi:hypothetical protein